MTTLSQRLSRPDYDDLGVDQRLPRIFSPDVTPTLEVWQSRRAEIRQRWETLLGRHAYGDFDREAEVVSTFEQPDYHGTVYHQPTGPDSRQLVLLMEPRRPAASPRPGAVVPFYHPDAMAGYDLAKGLPLAERTTVQFGLHLVRRGYVVVCTEAFPFNTVPEPKKNEGFAWWQAAADKLLREHPHWTGMGKLVWDARRAVDLLLAQPDIDTARILAIGHSLGGKMAFYAGVLDERIKAIIASDFGIGWSFTNWDDDWYLGDQIHTPGFSLAHHELLALHAPRPFLLIAGLYDGPPSWQYLQAAQQVYALYGRADAIGMFDHATGHQPPEEFIAIAYRWLGEQFNLPEHPPSQG